MAKTQRLTGFFRAAALPAALLAALLAAGCGGNCGDAARMGDFELSQGNIENAEKHYRRALETDSGCGEGQVREKLRLLQERQGTQGK